MSFRDACELLYFVAQTISLAFIALSIYVARKEANASRQLQIMLDLSASFRARWEASWAKTVRTIVETQETSKDNVVPAQYEDELRFMLNWIDWVGILKRTGLLTQYDVVFGGIGPAMSSIIKLGRPIVEKDISAKGKNYWSGLLDVAEALDLPMK
jgi:hypothetical protein